MCQLGGSSLDRRLDPGSDSKESRASAASSGIARRANGAPTDEFDWQRLERAIAALVDDHQRLSRENDSLRDRVATRDRRIQELDEQLMEANQRRQEVGKRIQELIAQIDHLDAELGGADA